MNQFWRGFLFGGFMALAYDRFRSNDMEGAVTMIGIWGVIALITVHNQRGEE